MGHFIACDSPVKCTEQCGAHNYTINKLHRQKLVVKKCDGINLVVLSDGFRRMVIVCNAKNN